MNFFIVLILLSYSEPEACLNKLILLNYLEPEACLNKLVHHFVLKKHISGVCIILKENMYSNRNFVNFVPPWI